MPYPGDFVAANRSARRDAAISFFRSAKKSRRSKSDLRRIYFRLWKWLAKRHLRSDNGHRSAQSLGQ